MTRVPLRVDIRRAAVVESSHTVHAVLMGHDGVLQECWGDAGLITFPRSTIKPLQALALMDSGAAAAYNLTDKELALSCASHGGQPEHVAVARAWLQKIGLTETDLECGHHWPSHKPSEHTLCRSGLTPCNLHNNCSGKHLGMMTTCLHKGWPVAGYTEPTHPLQQMIFEKFAALAGMKMDDLMIGIDGCNAPSPALPLDNIARAFAGLAQDGNGQRLLHVMSAQPFYVAGDKRFDTTLMQAFPNRFAVKAGAEGNQVIVNLTTGAVLYLKCIDGNTRAALAASGHLLTTLGWIDNDSAIAAFTRPVQKNWRGAITGDITVHIPPPL